MVCSCVIPSKSVFAANNILLMRNSNLARSLRSLLCEMEDRDRFPELSESELTSLLDQKNSANTKKATKSCFKRIHRSESSIRSYASQTSLSTKRKMSETLSESLNNKKTVLTTIAATSSVGHSEIPVAENTPEPLLTASQEEYILNELSKSNTQQTVINFYNCTFNF